MACPTCGAPTLPDSRFCTECGARLDATCPACATPNPPGAKFCRSCGTALAAAREDAPRSYTPPHLAEKILTSRSALEGERKQVTVLFVDVKGSMDLAARVDPEAWHRILDRFFAILADGVHRFEGTVNQFTGDGIMALFGAPIAHEDHAQRACHAALYLTDALAAYARDLRRTEGLPFSVRMGLNSGEVVVGRIGDDLRMDYTAQGHAVGMAARMEQIAEPGRVYLTDATAALVAGWFRLEDLGLFTLHGVREPQRVWALEGVGTHRTRLDASRARGFSQFVGRDTETAALEAALARAITGEGQIVGVVAEAGVGKSRLCWELLQHCRARGFTVHEAHAVAHGRSVPFLVALQLARSFFGVSPDDTDKAARQKIAGTLVLIDESLRDVLPLVFDFLGVADPTRPAPRLDPEQRRRQLATVVRRVVQAQSAREPAVVLVEDLHWIDGASEAFLHTLAEALPHTRMLLVLNFRPEYRGAWLPGPRYRELPLLPLGAEATTALLAELLGRDPSVAPLAAHVATSTAGNPFFIEEVVRTLVESGRLAGTRGSYRLVGPVADVAIPATVQAVLAARIDRLAQRDKAVLQTAAVIGKQVPEAVLRRVADLPEAALVASLRALAAAEFLDVQADGASTTYAFTHPLTQEVAYRSQLGARRARVHADVARALVALHPEKLDEQAALLAHHWEGAGDLLEAARWGRRAAEWVGISDFTEGLHLWRKVRALVASLPETAETRELRMTALSNVLNFTVRVGAPQAEKDAALAEITALRGGSDDPRMRVRLVGGPAALRLMSGDVGGALEDLQAPLALAERIGDPGLRLALEAITALGYFLAGRFRDGLALAERALAASRGDVSLGKDVFGFSPHILLLQMRGSMRRLLGRTAEGARDLADAAELAQRHGELELLSGAYQGEVFFDQYRGDAEAALAHARRALELADAIESPFSRTQAHEALGLAHLERREWDEARAHYERALAIARETGTGLPDEGAYLSGIALAHLGRGDAAGARTYAENAVRASRRRQTAWAECWAAYVLGRVLVETDARASGAGARAALDRALALVEATGGAVMEPVVRVARAALARAAGDEAAWRRELETAERLFARFDAPRRAAEVAAALRAGVEEPRPW